MHVTVLGAESAALKIPFVSSVMGQIGRCMLEKCHKNKIVVHDQIRNSVVGDDRSPAGHLCPAPKTKQNEPDANVGRNDLVEMTLLKDWRPRAEV